MTAAAPRSGPVVAFKVSCHVTTLLVLLQALLAGLFISGEELDAKDQHELMANIIFVAAAVQLVLAYLTRGWSRFGLVYWAGVILVLTVAQIGLGYASRDNTFPEAIHVPVGVLLFGLAAISSTLAILEDRTRA